MYRDINPSVEDACNKAIKRFSLAMTLVCVSSISFAGPWPKLVGGSTDQCKETLRVARSAFNSFAPRVYAFPKLPPNLNSVLVLGTRESDISGGDALEASDSVFQKLPSGKGAPRSVYWLKTATHGQRLAVQEMSMGWRGDTYSLFLLPENIHADDFVAHLKKDGRQPSSMPKPLMSMVWRPPLIFQTTSSRQLWFIDVRHPADFLAPWKIYLVESTGMKLSCTVEFRPNVNRAVDLLPKPVQELEH
ncbi:hypothetical protein, partial [Aquabacterium sp.]|uniref:hypothetical protein n=1 Tax=Aquabacterium sp. TaxID=1872578 RepID=UPI003D6D8064